MTASGNVIALNEFYGCFAAAHAGKICPENTCRLRLVGGGFAIGWIPASEKMHGVRRWLNWTIASSLFGKSALQTARLPLQ